MNPILESNLSFLEDKTAGVCEPNSLKVVMDAINEICHAPRYRIKIRTIYIEQTQFPEQDKDYPLMFDSKYTVNVGFEIKGEWYQAIVIMLYHYSPDSCCSRNCESVEFKKQVNGELVPFSFKQTG